MAGTLFSLAMSQWRDVNGRPEQDAPLYIYQANSSTPVNAYKDYGLSVLHPWPIRTNSMGMIPPFWLPDGLYRARLTNAAGSLIYFDEYVIQAVGPSVGGGGGGGGGVDQNAIFQTGDIMWQPRSGVRSGWVRANGRTIGSATSGATERANADTQSLFEYLYNTFSDDICPVTGGRGANAASDFAANKPIKLIDLRGRTPVGLDDMGNDAAGIITDGSPTSPGTVGGSELITIPRSALPNVGLTFSGTTSNNGLHGHPARYSGNPAGQADGFGGIMLDEASDGNYAAHTGTPSDTRGYQIGGAGAHTHTYSGTTQSMNGGVSQKSLNVMSPYMLGTWYIRL